MLLLLKIASDYLYNLRKASGLRYLHFIFFTFCFYVSFAQNGIIKGKVKDGETVLQAATVSIAHKSFLTDLAGEFSITISPGTYTLRITHVGYKKIEQPIILHAGETLSFEFNMIRDEQMGEVVVLGSRSGIQRSNLNTAVPVDRISSKELKQTGQPSLIQMLNFAAPSFNTSRQNLSDPVTLRGLGPDHLLILMNGTRYHNLAVINPGAIRGTLGRGSVSNDLNSIPFSAIEKIEILRDGASAQYGSDAIAGVMNIELKKTTGKTFINLHLGQQYKGDGESLVLGINRGIPIGKSLPAGRQGFLNFSGDFRYRMPTHRGGEYQGTVYYNIPTGATQPVSDSITALDNTKIQQRSFSRKTPVSNDGSIQLTSSGFLINGGYPINSQIELFWTGTVNYRHPVNPGAYRFPKNPSQVNTVLHPDGFKNKFIINTCDISGIAGARGKTNKEWNWEWNSVYGKNSGQFYSKNTNNASQFAMGANAPTEFDGGKSVFIQQTNTISLAKDFAKKITRVKTFNIGLGAEYRFEKFRTKEGEEAAWKNYDSSGKTQGGAQPAPGISPEGVVNKSRKVAGLYVDLETDINDQLLINMAGRYENYNDFGSNLAGKLAIRYKFSSAFSIRGSLSNGYHAPALQQIYYSLTLSSWKNVGGVRIPVRLGTFSNNSAVTQAFGVKPLQPEKAVNLSAGVTSTISPHINLTVDAYWIQIKNRIVLSGIFDKTNPDVNRILQNRPDIDQVQFITNAINTRTRGIDIVMNGKWKVSKTSLGLMLAANFTRTNIFGPIQLADSLKTNTTNTNTLFNREEREKIEHGQPASKIILSGNYKRGKVELLIRTTRFGKTSAVFNSANKSLDEFFSAKILTDFSISYSPKKWLTITAGANNVFNVYPDRVKNSTNTNQGILIYSNEAIQFGYNGGYYFVNMAFNW
jgi:iron complex outermembrane receptor protein